MYLLYGLTLIELWDNMPLADTSDYRSAENVISVTTHKNSDLDNDPRVKTVFAIDSVLQFTTY